MWGRNESGGMAKPEYATAKIAVWWDMKDCPIPEGYDARRVRPSIEGAFKELGYSGPVSITAYGNQTQTPGHILRGLSSTRVAVAHTSTESTCSLMYSDMVEWRGHNPPPATMMIISDQVKNVFEWDLSRLQQRTLYNIFLAYCIKSQFTSALLTRAEWLWGKLLGSEDINQTETRLVQDKCSSETSAMFYCKSCNFDCQSPERFRKHLSSYNHAREEDTNPTRTDLTYVTNTWERNYPATPEYATAKIAVWWDMFDCPVPEGYDARLVRPSLEAAFKKLGYSGPVSITAFGDLNHTPDHLLRVLSSTGVDVAHAIYDVAYKRMYSDFDEWIKHNPNPAIVMFISDSVEHLFSLLVHTLQKKKLNLFMAYSYRPCKMSNLVTSAEWLWESLLAETRGHVLQKCSESKRSESTGMFYCTLCLCYCKSLDSFKSLDSINTFASIGSTHNGVRCNGVSNVIIQKVYQTRKFA